VPAAPLASSAPITAPTERYFAVHIDSVPSGADVYEGAQLLGTTPMQLSVNAQSVADAPRTFSVRKAGLLPYTIVQGSSAVDVRLLAQLAPARAIPAAPAAKPKKARIVATPSATAKPQGDIFMQR
jgi:hypothetical protein